MQDNHDPLTAAGAGAGPGQLGSEENFHALFEAIDDLIVVATHQGRILFANTALQRALGYSAAELAGMHVLDLHPAELRREAEEILAALFRSERKMCPVPLAAKSGARLQVETRVWFGTWNGVDCIFGISKDVTREQEALENFSRLFNENPAPMAVSSLTDLTFVAVNDAFLHLLGFTREEVIGRTGAELHVDVQPERQQELTTQLLAHGRIAGCEMKIRCKDGTIVDGRFSGRVMERQGQKRLLTVMLDETTRNRTEEALRTSETRFRELVAQSPLSIQVVRANGTTILVNRAFEELWGVRFESMHGYNLLADDQFDAIGVRPYLQKVFAGEPVEFPIVEFTPRSGPLIGHKRVVQVIGYPIKDAAGAVREVTMIHQDVTERRRAEVQTAQQIDELRRWQTVTLGREGRVAELKREVNELAARLGEKPRYGTGGTT